MNEERTINQRLGDEIKKLRKSKGFSQKKFADLCGITPISMNKIEKGHQRPKEENLTKICNTLNIPVSFLHFLSVNASDFRDEKKQELFISYKPVLDSMINKLLEETTES